VLLLLLLLLLLLVVQAHSIHLQQKSTDMQQSMQQGNQAWWLRGEHFNHVCHAVIVVGKFCCVCMLLLLLLLLLLQVLLMAIMALVGPSFACSTTSN
jgi:hypothetical protein